MEAEQGVEIVGGDRGQAQAVAVLEKFPDEIWTIIFQYLRCNSMDLLNCTRVCRKWENILRPDQCDWMFDQVFPHIFTYLDKREILTTRQVGRKWRRVVDEFVETHESRLPFDEKRTKIGRKTLASILHHKKLKWNAFYEREHLVRFMNLIGQQPNTNPILGRALWIEFQEETEDEDENFQENSQFWNTVFQVLSLIGQHVWYFGLGTYGTRNTYRRFLYLLNRCLSLMPNLRSLHIFGWINESGDDTEENSLSAEEIPAFLENHPLPILPCLETVEISNMSGFPSVLQDHIISRHSEQLKCLQLSDWEDTRLATNIELPQLKELLVDVSRYRAMERIESLAHLSASPLGKLSLSFSSFESTLDMGRLFEIIGRFGDTLRSLRLTVIPGAARSAVVVNNVASLQLNFCAPHLQAIHLEGFNQLPLSFLRHVSSSLEFLEIRPLAATFRKTSYPDETVDLYQYLHCSKVYDSQIWVDFPKLKTIYFEFCDPCLGQFVDQYYTRTTYEYLKNLQNAP